MLPKLKQNSTIKPHLMQSSLKLITYCVLISIWALFACTPATTPIAIPTLTLVPATETPTRTPITPSPTFTASPIRPPPTLPVEMGRTLALIQTTLTPSVSLVTELQVDVARMRRANPDRVQLIQVDRFVWFDDNLRCGVTEQIPTDDEAQEYGEVVRGLRYLFILGSEVFEYRVSDDFYEFCLDTTRPTGDLLLLVDAAASDMLFLVQREVSRELDLSTRRIQLLDIAPYTWSDTSFGCPQPEQTYIEADIPGYRILVQAGDVEYLFHTDANTIYPCDIEDEVLPES